MCAAMLRRMDLEERRNEADEKTAETARIAAEAALKAKTPSALTGSASYIPGVAHMRLKKRKSTTIVLACGVAT